MFVDFPMRAKPPLSASQYSKMPSAGQLEESTGWSRNLAPKETLFRDGDRRTCIYRVESGAICLYEPHWNDERSVIDFAFPGDYVGLGFLETQSCNASAICECQVKCIPWEQLTSAIAGNPSAQQKLH
jgi:CRP/FNR family transcriptional regulator